MFLLFFSNIPPILLGVSPNTQVVMSHNKHPTLETDNVRCLGMSVPSSIAFDHAGQERLISCQTADR